MYNLLVTHGEEAWEENEYEFSRTRFCEYTVEELQKRYQVVDIKTLEELKSFPTVFAYERDASPARLGRITEIRLRSNKDLAIKYEFDPIFPAFPSSSMERLSNNLDIREWELNRTHWAIKDVALLDVLLAHNIVTEEQVAVSRGLTEKRSLEPANRPLLSNNKVFIVHGQDDRARLEMSRYVESLGLEAIVLHEQASSGKTIIEKIEAYSDVGFAVVLYTPCDSGRRSIASVERPRARQNVVFEHGYLIGKLGRPRVCALVKGDVETPNDISGIVYISMDDFGGWKEPLKREMKTNGYNLI
jgi:predicted nucleotide-binding protein